MAINELEIYDKAVFDFFKMTTDCGAIVTSVFSPPQRAFADLKTLLDLDLDDDTVRVPLPATSLHRGDPTFDPTRYRFTDRWVSRYDNAPTHNKVKVMGPPNTVSIEYTLEMWTYTQVEMLNLVKQLLMKFYGELGYILVDLGEYGKKRFSIQSGGMVDTSILEPQEEERTLRKTMSVTLNAVLFRPHETRKTVLTVETQICDDTTGDVLSTTEVTSDDV